MFFLFSKILAFMLAPVNWVAATMLIALFSKSRQMQRKALWASAMILLFFTNPFLLNEAALQWEIPATRYEKLQVYDVGIVLGDVLTYDPDFNRLQFNGANDRLMQALELYKKGYIRKILFAGGSGSVLDDQAQAPLAGRFLRTIGIPDNDVILETQSRNTHENAAFSKKILHKFFPGGKFLLITSASHQRRATACFYKEGIRVIPYSTDRIGGPERFAFDFLFLPNAHVLFLWEKLIKEMTGCIVYKAVGYI